MTATELDDVMTKAPGNLTDWQCRVIVSYIMGYIRHCTDINAARNELFKQIKAGLQKEGLPKI